MLNRENLQGRAAALLLLTNLALASGAAVQPQPQPQRRNLNRRVVTASEADDKYKSPPQAPLVWNGTAESIIATAKAMCERSRGVLDKIVAEVTPEEATWENVYVPMIVDGNSAMFTENPLYFYQYVSADKELRDASSEATTILDDCFVELSMREDMFKLIDAIYEKRESMDLDPETLRYVEKDHLGYINSGLGLPVEQRERFKEISNRLNELSNQHSRNLAEDNGGIWLTPEQLEGLPEDVLGALEKGTGENEGKLRLTFKYTDYVPFQTFGLDAEARMEAYIGYENRATDNVPILKEAIVLRDEAARMLGYDNHAQYRIKEKMAKTPETVMDFLDDLKVKLVPLAKVEIDHMLDLKAADLEKRGLEVDGKLYYWDLSFYGRILIENEFDINEIEVSEYFPLETTLDHLMGIFQELFGFIFVLLEDEDRKKLSPTGTGEDLLWNPDTIMYAVWDTEKFSDDDDGFRGYLYMDLHPRDGKYTHAANWGLIDGFKFENSTARSYPTTILVCNLSKPTATKPSLLKHDEVETLFHELGHGIHNLAGRTHYRLFSGTSVARDFVEAPSQMLENWVWTPSVLKDISNHYETGEPMSDDLIERLINTRHVNDAIGNERQLHYAIFDMMMHMQPSHEAAEEFDLSVVYNELRPKIQQGLSGPADYDPERFNSTWGNGEATLGHYMGGYDAGYYGYLWSAVYSFDMFYTNFKADPMNGAEGRRYRHMVLEKGGSQDEMKTLTDYLGRAPSTEAFYEELGLSESKKA